MCCPTTDDPVKVTKSTVLMAGQAVPNFRAWAGYNIVGARRKTGFGNDFSEQDGEVRRHFRGQVHHRVANC